MYVLIDTFDARCQSAGKDNKFTQQYLIHQFIERGAVGNRGDGNLRLHRAGRAGAR